MNQPKVTALDKLNMAMLDALGAKSGVLKGWCEIAAFLRVTKVTGVGRRDRAVLHAHGVGVRSDIVH